MELYAVQVNVIAIITIIVGIGLAVWWLVSLFGVHSREEEQELKEINLPSHLHETVSGIPPALLSFYIFIGVSLVVYVLYIWLGGFTY